MWFYGFFIVTILANAGYSQSDLTSFWRSLSLQKNANLIAEESGCLQQPENIPGRCIPFTNCLSAMQGLFEHGQKPTKCESNDQSNIICCTDSPLRWDTLTSTETPSTTTTTTTSTSSTTTTTTTTTTIKPSVPPINERLSNTPLRISEKECLKMYNTRKRTNLIWHFNSKESNSNESENENSTRPSNWPLFTLPIDLRGRFHTKVVSGFRVEEHEFPFMCTLGWTTDDHPDDITYNCGCVLISSRFVLTAAHCIADGNSPTLAHIGSKILNDSFGEKIKIDSIILHPQYKNDSIYNDIAIIKLQHSCRHKPACLWHQEDPDNRTLTALGYGQTSFGGPKSNALLKVFLEAVPRNKCYVWYLTERRLRVGLDDGQLCATDLSLKMDTCQGDSGGPLLIKESKSGKFIPYIIGLTSFGIGCSNGIPSIYTRISHFLDWIESIVWQ